MAMVRIHNDNSFIAFDGEYGNVVMINDNWEDGAAPLQFNVSEYRQHYRVSNLPAKIDIRDIGYRREDGVYQPPCEGYRNTKASGQAQGGRP